jgi:hypothetical protein
MKKRTIILTGIAACILSAAPALSREAYIDTMLFYNSYSNA